MEQKLKYEVRVLGQLGPAARQALADMSVQVMCPVSALSGAFDQAGLHDLFARIQALGLELADVRRVRLACERGLLNAASTRTSLRPVGGLRHAGKAKACPSLNAEGTGADVLPSRVAEYPAVHAAPADGERSADHRSRAALQIATHRNSSGRWAPDDRTTGMAYQRQVGQARPMLFMSNTSAATMAITLPPIATPQRHAHDERQVERAAPEVEWEDLPEPGDH